MTDYAEGLGLPVDHAFIDKIIEEAVQIMNAELGSDLDWLSGIEAPVTIAPAV